MNYQPFEFINKEARRAELSNLKKIAKEQRIQQAKNFGLTQQSESRKFIESLNTKTGPIDAVYPISDEKFCSRIASLTRQVTKEVLEETFEIDKGAKTAIDFANKIKWTQSGIENRSILTSMMFCKSHNLGLMCIPIQPVCNNEILSETLRKNKVLKHPCCEIQKDVEVYMPLQLIVLTSIMINVKLNESRRLFYLIKRSLSKKVVKTDRIFKEVINASNKSPNEEVLETAEEIILRTIGIDFDNRDPVEIIMENEVFETETKKEAAKKVVAWLDNGKAPSIDPEDLARMALDEVMAQDLELSTSDSSGTESEVETPKKVDKAQELNLTTSTSDSSGTASEVETPKKIDKAQELNLSTSTSDSSGTESEAETPMEVGKAQQ